MNLVKKEQSEVAQGDDKILNMIERICTNPDVDLDKMKMLMDLRDRENARIAKEAAARDYVDMKAELPRVAENYKNAQTKSNYAKLQDINEAIDPVLKKYGFATETPVVAQDENSVTVSAILTHREGSRESCNITLPLDMTGAQGAVNKTRVHATASSIMYARRLALCALLNISTGEAEDDGNAAGAQYITPEQAKELKGLVQSTGTDVKKFLEYTRANSVDEILAAHYQKAKNALTSKVQNDKV